MLVGTAVFVFLGGAVGGNVTGAAVLGAVICTDVLLSAVLLPFRVCSSRW